MQISTTGDWIDKLAAASDVISAMNLKSLIKNSQLNNNALNLASCDAHCNLIVRATDELVKKRFSTNKNTSDLLCNLIGKNTYGAFAELAAYDWLARCYTTIDTQIHMPANEVLSKNGSTLDGKIKLYETYFDVKAFGFNGHLVQRLKELLEDLIPNEQILIEESWDISSEKLQELIKSASSIAVELKEKNMMQFGRLKIRLVQKSPVSISSRIIDPYLLAQENALYPFKYAKQFTKNAPFVLIFVIHPWFNSLAIHNDFSGIDTAFTRSLARRAFMQFSTDMTPANTVCSSVADDVTLSDASCLLSAIFFVNVWPLDADSSIAHQMPSWLYLNPRARHRISVNQLSLYRANNPNGVHIDDFSSDNY
ncbi:hypothetical protein [Sulfuriferula nivalis]|uniref:Uncharacterized protein n=1 Tax=Sulfuriferula nivalis TaxID=2675298 RepID=A0A809RH90_9PROT|nr:hypothetical protein [Sulfuriferula nivalis]BBP00214.1 hypothetical protein SFSGTM_09220 [Sulfuriferula nivalis]